MDISFSENKFATILKLHSSHLTPKLLVQLSLLIQRIPNNKQIGINFLHVNSICKEFFYFLKAQTSKKNISIINLNPELFALLDLTQYCKFIKIYACENDFFENKRSIINRNFSAIGNS